MKRIGPNARRCLDRLEHPPTAEDMRDVMHALAWDGDTERLEQLAQQMMDHHHHRPDYERFDHSTQADDVRADHSRNFYYWLGARGVAMSMNESRRAANEAAFQSRREYRRRGRNPAVPPVSKGGVS